MKLTPELRQDYDSLWKGCTIKPAHQQAVRSITDMIVASRARYETIEKACGVPWYITGVIHNMECSLSFTKHLHNGDPMGANFNKRTVQVPAGRPKSAPPWTWEQSALDALEYDGFTEWKDWSLGGSLFKLEGYNGWGYRNYHPTVKSPYLWSFTNRYTKGKYKADGVWDANLVSQQAGVAALLKDLEVRGIITIGSAVPSTPADSTDYPGRVLKNGLLDDPAVKVLQKRLNKLGCGPLDEDGDFGRMTEEAVRLFQSRHSDSEGNPLIIDGEVGAITWGALFGKSSLIEEKPGGDALLADVLKMAKSQLSVREKPAYSNRGPEVDAYNKAAGAPMASFWCASFVYWCFEQAAKAATASNPCIKTAHCLTHWNKAGEKGVPRVTAKAAVNDPSLVKPGMIFIIQTSSDGSGHTGLVESLNGSTITTIEGNTDPGGSRNGYGVFRRTRKLNGINVGFIDYSA